MAQCLKNGCTKTAVNHNYRTGGLRRKRYCREHFEQYAAKQREMQKRGEAAPKCACGEPLMNEVRVEAGRCANCARMRQHYAEQYEKDDAFRRAETVQELKDWMQRYML